MPDTITLPDSLFDLAFAYKQTKLWKLLWDTQLFAIQFSDGQIGYCSVMGMAGEHNALAVYIGQAGLDSYRAIAGGASEQAFDMVDDDGNVLPTFQSHERMMSQDCLQCAFEKKADMRDWSVRAVQTYSKRNDLRLAGHYPDFVRYRPYRFPWYIRDAIEQGYMAEALQAAIEVAKRIDADVAAYQAEIPAFATRDAREVVRGKLGFSEGAPYRKKIPLLTMKEGAFVWSSITLPNEKKKQYPSPLITSDDILLARVKRAKMRVGHNGQGTSWYCDIVMLPQPLRGEDQDGAGITGATVVTGVAGSGETDEAEATSRTSKPNAALDQAAEPIEAPYFAMAMLVIDSEMRQIVSTPMIPQLDEAGCGKIIRALAESIIQDGKPQSFIVKRNDARTRTILQAFAEQVGVEMTSCADDDDVLLDAEMNLLAYFDNNANSGSPDESFNATLNGITKQLMGMKDSELRTMPNDLRNLLLEEAHAGRLDQDLARRLIRVLEGK